VHYLVLKLLVVVERTKQWQVHFNEKSLTKIGVTCSGGRPWLGQEADRGNAIHCGDDLRVVQKGASNVYFSQVRSSIYLTSMGGIQLIRRLVEVSGKKLGVSVTSGMENGEFSANEI
jgi:hypothetical protein